MGEAGVGKTAILQAAIADARTAGDRVVRCTATQSAAALPLAALAPLLDSSSAAQPPLERILLALDALQVSADRVVLAVDDAHLLDEASAVAVRTAFDTDRATVLLTVRSSVDAPDAIAGLWNQRLVEIIEVAPLTREAAGAMVAELVGGEVDAGTTARLHSVTDGNALFLRELVAHGAATGALSRRDGLWTWDGELRPGPRLIDLVGARLDLLDPGARFVAELVAAAEPVPLDVLCSVVAPAPLARAERSGILVTERSQRRALVRCAHPLHAAALRERAAQSAVRAGLAALAEAIEATGAHRAEDPLRIGLWLLDAGRVPRPSLLTEAAARAHAHGHVLLAERLARSAIDAGGGDDARLVLHDTLIWQARVTEADAVIAQTAADEQSRVLVAGSRVDAFLVGAEEYDSVVAALAAAEALTVAPDLRAELVARRAGLDLAATGETGAAIAPWDTRDDAPPVVTLRLAFGAAPALAAAGRTDDAVAAASEGLAALKRLDEPLTFAAEQLAASTGFALLLAGRVGEAESCVGGVYDDAVRSGDRFAQALLAVPAAELDLWQGHPRAAARRAAEALAHSGGVDRMGFCTWATGLRAHATAWLGEPTNDDVEADVARSWPHSGEFLHSFAGLSYARAALARGEHSAALELARQLGALAEERGQPAVAALAYDVIARAGEARDASVLLANIRKACDGALVPLLADHARALAAADADALIATASRAEALGVTALAAEAVARAEELFRREGHRGAAARAGTALRRIVATMDAAPVIPGSSGRPTGLTRREREVASLAGRGLTNGEIAARLGVSIRTVHTHLQSAYAKLGTSDRAELAALLAAR
jgi:DNA-binding CsgD family transcriptional regulator